jgi:hypothetical protein
MLKVPVFAADLHSIVGPSVTSSFEAVPDFFSETKAAVPVVTSLFSLHSATLLPSCALSGHSAAEAEADETALHANTANTLNMINLMRI